jgi:hypothetical protein
MQTEANMPEHTNLPGSDLDANFVGWQENLSGDFFPIFTITVAGHPSFQSKQQQLHEVKLGINKGATK